MNKFTMLTPFLFLFLFWKENLERHIFWKDTISFERNSNVVKISFLETHFIWTHFFGFFWKKRTKHFFLKAFSNMVKIFFWKNTFFSHLFWIFKRKRENILFWKLFRKRHFFEKSISFRKIFKREISFLVFERPCFKKSILWTQGSNSR